MLTTLRIKNLALVDDLCVEFQPGFNALTGETGAGKSVIIGGIQLLIGGRADKSLIRSGQNQCLVEALFDVSQLIDALDNTLMDLGLEPCEENTLTIKRSISNAGSSRQFINGSPCTVKTLAQVGSLLVDIHGPHDAQSLNDNKRQLEIVDACANSSKPKSLLADLTHQKNQLIRSNAELAMDDQEFSRQVEILEYQIQEIKSANLTPEDEDNLENQYQKAANAAQIHSLCQEADYYISESEASVQSIIHQISKSLNQVSQFDQDASHLTGLIDQISALTSELSHDIHSYTDNIELDPNHLHQLEQKFSLLQTLKKKYGQSIQDILDFAHAAEQKLDTLQNRELQLEQFKEKLNALDKERLAAAHSLSKKRRKVISQLSKQIQSHLNDLGFNQNHFEIQMDSTPEVHPDSLPVSGFDKIEFLFSPNPGEPLKPLKSIASSGELARVMLGIKTVLAANDAIPLLVFDEVDANVGGETAPVVGQKLRKIGENRQTLCITHLAPVAAAADNHFLVEKSVYKGRTTTRLAQLTPTSRTKEIARMLGGSSTTILNHAKSLLTP